MAGQAIALDGNATIRAPGGTVNAYAATNPRQLVTSPTSKSADSGGTFYIGQPQRNRRLRLEGRSGSGNAEHRCSHTRNQRPAGRSAFSRRLSARGAKVNVDLAHPPTLFDIKPYKEQHRAGSQPDPDQRWLGIPAGHGQRDYPRGFHRECLRQAAASRFKAATARAPPFSWVRSGNRYNISTAPRDIQYTGFAK